MSKTITVKGSNDLVVNLRYEALSEINKLDDTSLERLGMLAKSPKAKGYIKSKWPMLKGFLGIR